MSRCPSAIRTAATAATNTISKTKPNKISTPHLPSLPGAFRAGHPACLKNPETASVLMNAPAEHALGTRRARSVVLAILALILGARIAGAADAGGRYEACWARPVI